jgi:ABC-type Fe3+-hydroxamate transport system substrate-binding protein
MRSVIAACTVLLAACGVASDPGTHLDGTPIPMAYAKTFTVVERNGYRVVELRSFLVAWGGGSNAPEQTARIVLVPHDQPQPALVGALAKAQVVRVPVQRIAVNYGSMEAILTALGVDDRLVAVGGVKSYNDAIRQRVKSGQLAQIGYGWHSPPDLASLVAAKPELVLLSLADLSHVQQMERIQAMGIAAMPVFIDNEPHYLGSVDYVRLIGMLTGREREAEAFVATVQRNVTAITAKTKASRGRPVISAWYSGGDKWMAVVRGADARLLTDAGGINLLAQDEDPRQDNYRSVSSETLLVAGRDAGCWVWRDTHSQHYPDSRFLQQFRAVRDGCLYASDGQAKPAEDAFDYYERGAIRPDLELADLARMLHPDLFDQPYTFIRPDTLRPF